MSDNFRTYFVVNPNSANGSTARDWPGIQRQLEAALGEFGWGMTESMGDATRLAREALEQGYEQIVSVGGDGTNNEVVNGFFREDGAPVRDDAVFSFITRGTGGDFRRIFGFDRQVETFVANLKGRDASPCDVGKLTFVDHDDREAVRYFINITSFGIGGLVDEKVNQSTKAFGGKASFMIGTLKALMQYQNQTVRFTVDDGEQRTETINTIAVANGQFFGGGMWVAPEARIDDGLFDIVIMGDLTKWEVIRNSGSIYKGEHFSRDKISHLQGRIVRAESDERVLLDVDGEQPGRLPATLECLPGAIRVKGRQV